MQIYANQLSRPWNKVLPNKIAPAYFIYGGEPQQTIDAQTALNSQLKQHGFTTRHCLRVTDPGFSWDQFADVTRNLNLFSSKQLIELDINQANIGLQGSNALLKFLQNYSIDVCLILIADKLEDNVKRSKWFTAVSNQGCIIITKQIYAHQFADYTNSRFNVAGLSLSKDAVAYVARSYTGNTVGLANLIAKIQLCLNSPLPGSNTSYINSPLLESSYKHLDLADITPYIDADANFTVFELVDAAVSRDISATYKMLETIKNSKIDPIIVIWAFIREVRSLLTIYYLTQIGTSLADACSANGVWSTKVPAIRAYLATVSVVCLENLLQNSLEVDTMTKTVNANVVWLSLSALYLNLAGAQQLSVFSDSNCRLMRTYNLIP